MLSHLSFQAEDGIRDYKVTGVQTCALPISDSALVKHAGHHHFEDLLKRGIRLYEHQKTMIHQKIMIVDGMWSHVGSKIGRASCRERGSIAVAGGSAGSKSCVLMWRAR